MATSPTFPIEIRCFRYDLVHFAPDGNRLLAGEFAQFLVRRVSPQIVLRQQQVVRGPRR
jgi:hypothetical protein